MLAIALSEATAPATTFVAVLLASSTPARAVSLIVVGIGATLLLFARARGRRRIEPALTWILTVVVLALLGAAALSLDPNVIFETSAGSWTA